LLWYLVLIAWSILAKTKSVDQDSDSQTS